MGAVVTPTPKEQLDILYERGLGILSAVIAHNAGGFHGGDEKARDAAEGSFVRLLLRRWERLHEDYRTFMLAQIEEGKKPKEAKK